ncbi:GNAT family N-acetyltransferase [Aeromicrobium sp. 636]|uniref:GNAT family N-acetyltransferase n=1 Tax=Aeromicrobium senzhongii TaxID=2663859 RepID=A0A8I0JZJ9_9ACTN|nr:MULTISPECIES: GNAT family N-acetyltransferase [Aeromicrobium]MBC9224783.1 GNAT family N-acetyltransferase [Aeromicrobium senzhongii]MCQ3996896.1 GNAT family N-acetyltransferase [Aeromicrobium sp. 636]
MNADVSVRLAWPDDGARIAAVQRAHWLRSYGDLVDPAELEALDETVMTARWTQLISAPRDARMRTLVALERATLRGFALVHPCHDPDADQVRDAEIGEFVVDADHRSLGHGSRLLHACVDTVRADSFERAVWWVSPTDDELRAWLKESGWEPDGAHREFAGANGPVKQIRLHTTLT